MVVITILGVLSVFLLFNMLLSEYFIVKINNEESVKELSRNFYKETYTKFALTIIASICWGIILNHIL